MVLVPSSNKCVTPEGSSNGLSPNGSCASGLSCKALSTNGLSINILHHDDFQDFLVYTHV